MTRSQKVTRLGVNKSGAASVFTFDLDWENVGTKSLDDL